MRVLFFLLLSHNTILVIHIEDTLPTRMILPFAIISLESSFQGKRKKNGIQTFSRNHISVRVREESNNNPSPSNKNLASLMFDGFASATNNITRQATCDRDRFPTLAHFPTLAGWLGFDDHFPSLSQSHFPSDANRALLVSNLQRCQMWIFLSC